MLHCTLSGREAAPVAVDAKLDIEWSHRYGLLRGDSLLRERVAFLIIIAVLIVLFALTFAVLGKGAYEPGGNTSPIDYPVSA